MRNPHGRHRHTVRYRRLVRAIQKRGGAYSPYAIATSRLGPSLLKNPLSPKEQKALRIAHKIAHTIWMNIKKKHFSIPYKRKLPRRVKKYVRLILRSNGIKWRV